MDGKAKKIKELFAQIERKTDFILLVCEELGGKPNTKKNHWFCDSGFWSVPDKHQDAVILLLEVELETEKKFDKK